MDLKHMGKRAGDTAAKALVAGGKAADEAQIKLKDAANAAQQVARNLKQSYYNPVFPQEFLNEAFDLPKIIVIADEDQRKGIDVCEGSIGWLRKNGGIEILHLYEEFVPNSGITFYPIPTCDAVYYIDPFDKSRYVNLSCYFDTMQRDKTTELRNIAFMLGAKSCKLEMYEETKEIRIAKGKSSKKLKGQLENQSFKIDMDTDAALEQQKTQSRSIVFEQSFGSQREPAQPSLNWFRNDREILSLINIRLSGGSCEESYRIKLSSSASATMSLSMASKIDAVLKHLGAKGNISISGEVQNEFRHKMELVIDF